MLHFERQIQIDEIEGKIDSLNEEFVELSRKSVEAGDNIQSIEEELRAQTDHLKSLDEGSRDHEDQRKIIKDTTTRLAHARTSFETLALKKNSSVQRSKAFKSQLKEKQQQLEDYQKSPGKKPREEKKPAAQQKEAPKPEPKETPQKKGGAAKQSKKAQKSKK